MARNNLHSFTLWPEASKIIDSVRNGKKSEHASKSIVWFSKPRDFIVKEYEYENHDGEVKKYTRNIRLVDLSELIEANEKIQKQLTRVCIELRDERSKPKSFISKMLNFRNK